MEEIEHLAMIGSARYATVPVRGLFINNLAPHFNRNLKKR